MPWQTKVHSNPLIVETLYAGLLTPSELTDAVQETIKLVHTTGATRLLADCTTLLGGHSIVDLYRVAESLDKDFASHSLREALLLPANAIAAEQVQFWETTCFNRGIQAKVFHDRPSALVWLNG